MSETAETANESESDSRWNKKISPTIYNKNRAVIGQPMHINIILLQLLLGQHKHFWHLSRWIAMRAIQLKQTAWSQ